ncbi:pyridoxamine 5'-phosphate oxidase family protein [Nocardia terpenica]|uniref:pyridoxamine 5'-phosphate oxidase family protein n=1 Tax=Nocardia terpenica TaxID=455432 RepID=UPI001894B5B6|nr:pyridoxamine 5'-phosphate oxidase family protein [Nocardia terpenica]MBF6059163.1 pyridoxamine 5'-phosphate oxidase family protein [Nocardia terpenica]MBF6103298.1 pyridoxamine 5'-phosphate oxidase family protein [Nocardia terpenica]MBF6110513.1 pyridoxamine 5'-phosphate oxidase family protein [Nocardia terpenica]MBF6116644.1 pyridoxamine 5'-phosphate oxidase family protein [Nocardia terpenica]
MTDLTDSRHLSPEESLRRLAGISFGRIVYTRFALINMHPADHLVDGGAIVVRAHPEGLTLTTEPQVVLYQADTIDHFTRTGWFVTATGMSEEVIDPVDHARYERFLTAHTLNTDRDDRIICIRPAITFGTVYSRLGPVLS